MWIIYIDAITDQHGNTQLIQYSYSAELYLLVTDLVTPCMARYVSLCSITFRQKFPAESSTFSLQFGTSAN